MKKNSLAKRILGVVLTGALTLATLTGCGADKEKDSKVLLNVIIIIVDLWVTVQVLTESLVQWDLLKVI